MKFKKVLAAGLASITLLSTSATTVSAHSKGTLVDLTNDIPAYNAKGKKIKKAHPFYQGDLYEILGIKKIKGKKFYRLTKTKYVIADDSKIVKHIPSITVRPKWESKHLVDTSGDIYEQTWKAYQLHGDDRLEAFKEIAYQKQMLTNSGEILGGVESFETKIKTDYYNHMEAVTGKPFTEDTLK